MATITNPTPAPAPAPPWTPQHRASCVAGENGARALPAAVRDPDDLMGARFGREPPSLAALEPQAVSTWPCYGRSRTTSPTTWPGAPAPAPPPAALAAV